MSPRFGSKVTLIGALVLGSATTATAGIDPEQNIDGFDPAAESFRINEARRLNAISRQLELTYRMMQMHGYNPASPPIEQPIGQETIELGPGKWLSRPVYDEPAGPEVVDPIPGSVEVLPAPTPTGPMLVPPGPSDAKPGDYISPRPENAPKRMAPKQKPSSRRPREF